jgi:hypothetical protein
MDVFPVVGSVPTQRPCGVNGVCLAGLRQRAVGAWLRCRVAPGSGLCRWGRRWPEWVVRVGGRRGTRMIYVLGGVVRIGDLGGVSCPDEGVRQHIRRPRRRSVYLVCEPPSLYNRCQP